MQVSPKTACVQSDANVPNPATHCFRMEYASHERRLTKLQRFKALVHSSPRGPTDELTLQTALKIQLAAGLEGRQPRPGARSNSYDPAARCRAPTSEACVCRFFTCYIQRHHSGFAPSRGGFEHRGADPTIAGTRLHSTAFKAVEVSSIMAMIYL